MLGAFPGRLLWGSSETGLIFYLKQSFLVECFGVEIVGSSVDSFSSSILIKSSLEDVQFWNLSLSTETFATKLSKLKPTGVEQFTHVI